MVVYENSFSSGPGKQYTKHQLQKMMVHNQFQALPATVVLLGQDNPPTCIAIDAKDKHAAQIEVKRVQAAAVKHNLQIPLETFNGIHMVFTAAVTQIVDVYFCVKVV